MNTQRRDWIILRCSGASTLKLASSLKSAGFEAWTPREMQQTREGETRSRRKDFVPVMPTYCFARAADLLELIAMSQAPVNVYREWDEGLQREVVKEVPDFSVFRYFGQVPVISDATLDHLRVAEQCGQPIDEACKINVDDTVRYPENGFEGLSGHVVQIKSKGRLALVAFGSLHIEIATMLLLADNPQPEARAA